MPATCAISIFCALLLEAVKLLFFIETGKRSLTVRTPKYAQRLLHKNFLNIV